MGDIGAISSVAAAAVRVTSKETGAVPSLLHAGEPTGHGPVVIVGLNAAPPKTTQSLIRELTELGLKPGQDVISTRYSDLRVGRDGGFVRLAGQADTLAGLGADATFLFRGGGNLAPAQFRKIGAIQSVEGATVLSDLSFIERAGSKAITNDRLAAAALPLPRTISVQGAKQAIAGLHEIQGAGSGDVVLKKVNSLGGQDVHFVKTEAEVRAVIDAEPEAGFVVQEYLPAARDQDIRVHMVWNHDTGLHEVEHSYVRNRAPGAKTPNLANGGFPTKYVPSPWEQVQAQRAAAVLTEGSAQPPLHVGLDFFPREPITTATVKRNEELQELSRSGAAGRAAALAADAHNVVIGEAASSAGTKGTELLLGEGVNPVTARMADEIVHVRTHGPTQLQPGEMAQRSRDMDPDALLPGA
ncbi:MAG: RimK-like ATP-grasp domain [Thermoleophilia bacterium]|nr:RimK-like ATP-grasp domain [Thermoleophilia bacterium]